MMCSHADVQSKVEALSLTNTQLENDISGLALCHKRAETRLELETQDLKGLIHGTLPSVIDVLSRDTPLVSSKVMIM